jgi:hypothetical protein
VEYEWEGLLSIERTADKWAGLQPGRNKELSQEKGNVIERQ